MSLAEDVRHMVPNLTSGLAFVYILRLRSGALYVGCSDNLEFRMQAHSEGTSCQTTATDAPIAVLFLEKHNDFASARKREAQLKHWSRAKKEALIVSDFRRLSKLSRSRT